MIGDQYVNNHCSKEEEPKYTGCSFSDRYSIKRWNETNKYFERNGVIFWFEVSADIENYYFKGLTIRVRLTENRRPTNSTFPQHFFNSLSKTEKGTDYLRSQNVLESLKETISSEKSTIKEKRAALWAVAHIGWTDYGMEL